MFGVFRRELGEFSEIIFSNEAIFLRGEPPTPLPDPLASEIQQSKVVLEFVDNPRRLWAHLRPKFRNLFYEYLIVTKQALRLARPGLSLHQLTDALPDANPNSEFTRFVCKKLNRFKTDNLDANESCAGHLRQILREIFEGWFLVCFHQDAFAGETLPDGAMGLINEDLRKSSKIIGFQPDPPVGTGTAPARLDRVGGLESLFDPR